MKNIFLEIQYDGTNFQGYQAQEGARTVEGSLKEAVQKLTGENNRLIAAGRTDAGVHADSQVVNFLTCSKIRPDKFYFHLVPLLPDDIAPVASKEVDLNFHSRFNAKSKTYRYTINLSKSMHPIYRNYMENVTYKLDFEKIQEGLDLLKGQHDFSAFKVNDKGPQVNPLRKIDACRQEKDGNILKLYFKGESFLHGQVRIMAGSLVELGRGKITRKDFENYLKPESGEKAGPALRAGGLYLERIEF